MFQYQIILHLGAGFLGGFAIVATLSPGFDT
uniref:Uncharacterized protein n=1 Tax=Arundo donax TaxID=35708 RepID=A0A0A9AYC6_ARUDO